MTEETTEGWIVTSKDAVDWSIQTFPGVHILSVANDGKKWLAAGSKVDDHGKNVPILPESANAEAWVPRALRTTHVPEDSMVRHISYGGGYWVAVMESQVAGDKVESWLFESEDGNEWTDMLHLPGAASKPCFGGSEWCFLLNQTLENVQATAQTQMLVSSNRKDWISTRPDLPGDAHSHTSLGYTYTL